MEVLNTVKVLLICSIEELITLIASWHLASPHSLSVDTSHYTVISSLFRNTLIQDKNSVRICSDMDKPHGVIDFGDMLLTESAKITDITIHNTGSHPIKLKRFSALGHVSEFILSDRHDLTKSGKVAKVVPVQVGKKYKIQALFKPSNLGHFKQVIVFEIEGGSPEPTSFHIARFLTGQGTNEEVESILPTEKYQHPAPVARVVDPEVSIVSGMPPPQYVKLYVFF